MRFKPKEVYVNLPIALTFATDDEIAQTASAFNTFLHGKVRLKCEHLGTLGGQYVGIFYLQRNNEFQQLRDEFMRLIEAEEIATYNHEDIKIEDDEDYYDEPDKSLPKNDPAKVYDYDFGDDRLCLCGHSYYRHFDSYDEMYPIGCKYCGFECSGFKEKI